MHVLILSQIFPPDMGGSATRAYNVAKGLVLNNVKVTVIAGFPHYPTGNVPKHLRKKALSIEYMEGFKVIRTYIPPIPAKGLANRMILFASFIISSIFPIFLVRKVDVVFASNPQVLAIFPALIYKVHHKCPIVLNVDDLWPEDPIDLGLIKSNILRKISRLIAKIAYSMADAITPISPGYVKVICERYNVNPSKVNVIRAGVDLNKFKAYAKANRENVFKVLYSGAFSIAYDFDQVLLAAKLLESVKDVEFILQGGGELAPYLKAKVKELKLENVKIIDKILSRDEVAKLLSEADALILPLRDFGRPYLGISSKLYEYQAIGKPIICCANGQPAEYIKETKSGIVVKPGDYEAIAKAILYLKNNLNLAKELGDSGRCYVESNLSIEKIGKEIIAVFDKA
jgi:glycosyltransferase involved in cell wall biosynthesis